MENPPNVYSLFSHAFLLYFPSRYRRKPSLYGIKGLFGTYLAADQHGIIRVGDPIHVLKEDKNF